MPRDQRLDTPADLPPEFKGWLVRYLEDNLAFLSTFLRLVSPGKRAASGTSSWSWPGASELSSKTTVTHGLGVAPAQVLVTPGEDATLTLLPAFQVSGISSTTFDVQASTIDGTLPTVFDTCTFYWLAIG